MRRARTLPRYEGCDGPVCSYRDGGAAEQGLDVAHEAATGIDAESGEVEDETSASSSRGQAQVNGGVAGMCLQDAFQLSGELAGDLVLAQGDDHGGLPVALGGGHVEGFDLLGDEGDGGGFVVVFLLANAAGDGDDGVL